MLDQIDQIITQNIKIHEKLYDIIPLIEKASDIMTASVASGGKIMFAGNGGSAADAQHLAAELVNRFLFNRRPLAGLALTTDSSNLTSIGNDFSFDEIFSKQVEALGNKGDVFLGISTSGNSKNIVRAIESASKRGITTIGLSGNGGRMKEICDCCICVPSDETPRIQECHILIGHILCGIIEQRCCGDNVNPDESV